MPKGLIQNDHASVEYVRAAAIKMIKEDYCDHIDIIAMRTSMNSELIHDKRVSEYFYMNFYTSTTFRKKVYMRIYKNLLLDLANSIVWGILVECREENIEIYSLDKCIEIINFKCYNMQNKKISIAEWERWT